MTARQLKENTSTIGVACLSVTAMYGKPSHSSEMVNQVLLGTPLKVLAIKDTWYKVKTPDGYSGWMDETLTIMTRAQYGVWLKKKKLMVTADHGFARAGVATASDVVSDLVVGDVLAVAGNTTRHYRVEYPDGKRAYLLKNLATPLNQWLRKAHATPASIIKTAKRFLGHPYLWGGNSSKALDCSGLVKLAYFLNGIHLPRDAALQARTGLLVAKNKIRAGDLLFFGTRQKIAHVGIALDATTFIHASGKVRITSLDPSDPRYSERLTRAFILAKRIIGAGALPGVTKLSDLSWFPDSQKEINKRGCSGHPLLPLYS